MACSVFGTTKGIRIPSVSLEQMRELDSLAEQAGLSGAAMTESDGQCIMELIRQIWLRRTRKKRRSRRRCGKGPLKRTKASTATKKAIVLVGKGGNGAGGLAAARFLANQGILVYFCSDSPVNKFISNTASQRSLALLAGAKEITEQSLRELPLHRHDLIVDSLLGYGIKGAPRAAAAGLITWANDTRREHGTCILAVDTPSGMHATTGHEAGVCIRATHTLALGLPKLGLLLNVAAAGKVFVGDVGIPSACFRAVGAVADGVTDDGAIGDGSVVPTAVAQKNHGSSVQALEIEYHSPFLKGIVVALERLS